MLGIDATFGDVSFDDGRNPRRVLHPIVPGAVALALAGCVGVWVLHMRPAADPDSVLARSAAEVAPNPYGVIIIDPSFLSEMKPATATENLSRLASLKAAPPAPSAPIPLPSLEAIPPAPTTAIPLPENLPLPPKRDVPQIADIAPLPPPRPPEFGPPMRPAADRNIAQQTARTPAAPADNRNFFEKLFGLGRPSGPAAASKAPESRVASAAPQGRIPGMAIFDASPPVAGYDRWTAVYDISARTVYLPDGTRLEAHSGLGDRLDDPRFVSERMRGATPPSLYDLEPREASFHGVQALRLRPVGDSGVFGRAGLLAHPYMLGPNGDSNGCVSVKDYDAFLRAYQNGQVKRLAVVARLG